MRLGGVVSHTRCSTCGKGHGIISGSEVWGRGMDTIVLLLSSSRLRTTDLPTQINCTSSLRSWNGNNAYQSMYTYAGF